MQRTSNELFRQIRQRPGMYVGNTGAYGLHRLPLLLLQAGAIAAREARGYEVHLHLEEGGACVFTFNGQLWPSLLVSEPPGDSLARLLTLADADPHAVRPEEAPETFILLSPFEDLAIVNALSFDFEVSIGSGGKIWRQTFRCGDPLGSAREAPVSKEVPSSFRGTRIRFVPDPSVFERAQFSLLGLAWRVEELAALHELVTFHLSDDVHQFEGHYRFVSGLAEYTAQLSAQALPLHEPWFLEVYHGTTRIRTCLQWCETPGSRVRSWVNQFRAHGGTHLEGLARGLHGALYHYAEAVGRASELSDYIPSVLMDGLTALLDVTVPRPVWLGPAKGVLANEDCEIDVAEMVQVWLLQRFAAEPEVAARVLDLVTARSIARG